MPQRCLGQLTFPLAVPATGRRFRARGVHLLALEAFFGSSLNDAPTPLKFLKNRALPRRDARSILGQLTTLIIYPVLSAMILGLKRERVAIFDNLRYTANQARPTSQA